MGKRTPLPMCDVTVTMLANDRALIEGGKLNSAYGWVVKVDRSRDGKPLIVLSTTSAPLSQLVGTSLTSNKWLESITLVRNKASDDALIALARAKGFVVLDTKWNKWAAVRGGKTSLAALAECPDTVTASIITHEPDDTMVVSKIVCMFSVSATAAPKVELSSENMSAIVRSIVAESSAECARGRKRSRSDRVTWSYPEIKNRPDQNAAMVSYQNADGRTCYHQEKYEALDDGSMVEGEVERVSELLHKFYVENNYNNDGGDVGGEDANVGVEGNAGDVGDGANAERNRDGGSD